MNKDMILEKVELVSYNINCIVCNSKGWEMTVPNMLYYWRDHIDKNDDHFYKFWMDKLMHGLEKYDFTYVDNDTKNVLLALGRADDIPLGIKTTTEECIMNLIKNFSDNLIIQYCVFLLLKKWYNIEQAKTSTMNGYLLGL